MKTTMYILIFILIFTAKALAIKCDFFEKGNLAPPRPSFLAPDIMNKVHNQLEQTKGIGRFIKEIPSSYDQIFFQEKDFTFESVNKRSQESVEHWSKELTQNQITNYINYNFDWATFKEFNLIADDIWQTMLSCNSSDLFQVRKNYFIGKPCPLQGDSEKVKTALSELSANFIQFLQTNEVFAFKKSCTSYVDCNFTHSDINLSIPFQHPLLNQIALQTWAVLQNLIVEDQRDDARGLFLVVDDLLRSYKNPFVNAHYKSSSLQWAKLHFNLGQILKGHNRGCDAYGLWPAMNRAIIFINFESFSVGGELRKIVNEMSEKSEKSCGSKVEFLKEGYGTYSNFSLAHVYETRRLFAAYYPAQLSKQFKKVVESSGLTPYQELVCE